MKIDIQTLSFHPDEKLLDFAEEKLGKLGQYSEQIIEAQMSLRFDRSATRDNKFCQIRLVVPGYDLFASKQSHSFEEAILRTCEALKQQMSRRKSNYQRVPLSTAYKKDLKL
ncbi:MAG TPA: HPF/RaiA family ribosome-associated protein [Cyclobacteriaceae bacterium]|nr:HPF/RaiA family ribosome-associated protein [Cyclobacteriaceae bacterium]